ncbi:MAG: EutN/CcmL family microcompartment protein [Gemmatimonadetes bacterium]|nr:EutN/CcmL family microcompartment protein [Gemmatimonadota bacterium]
MRLARVMGTVVMTQKLASLTGQRFLIVQPVTAAGKSNGEPFVALDTVSAGRGELVSIVEKREGAKAFGENDLPSDGTIVAIIDEVRSVK